MESPSEAERERRAKVINARGEPEASEELRQAADTLSRSPASLQLRYLQTLLELGADQNSTVVFPLPVDIIGPFLDKLVTAPGASASAGGNGASARHGRPVGRPADSWSATGPRGDGPPGSIPGRRSTHAGSRLDCG